MASRSIEKLIPEMQKPAERLKLLCYERGFEILVYCTYRSLAEQAKLYRRGRAYFQIKAKINRLRQNRFYILAETIESVGPQYGPKVTNAGPGESWHNWRRAFDAVPLIGGKPAWNYSQYKDLFDLFGKSAEECGLYWAGRWRSFPEYVHFQFDLEASPLNVFLKSGLGSAEIERKLYSGDVA